MNNKLKAALIGGVIVGLPSAIPVLNYCCCIWGIGGGVVAGLLYIKGSQTRVPTGDGAIVGGLAGVVGGVIYLILDCQSLYYLEPRRSRKPGLNLAFRCRSQALC